MYHFSSTRFNGVSAGPAFASTRTRSKRRKSFALRAKNTGITHRMLNVSEFVLARRNPRRTYCHLSLSDYSILCVRQNHVTMETITIY